MASPRALLTASLHGWGCPGSQVHWANVSCAGRRAHKATVNLPVTLTTSLSGGVVFQRAVSKAINAAGGWLLAVPGWASPPCPLLG